MKLREISVQSAHFVRILCHGSLVALALLCVGFWAASVSAKPVPAPQVQYLPTRPRPTSAPAPPPPTSVPTPPARPRATAAPPAPGPTPAGISPPTTQITATEEGVPEEPLTQGVNLTFRELGYGILHFTEMGSTLIHLYLPRNLIFREEGNYLELLISHVPPVPDQLSILSMSLNNETVAVIRMTEENAELTSLRFNLPPSFLEAGHNRLELALDTGEMCGIRGATIDVRIDNSSLFHLEYDLVPYPVDLALYPAPFYESSSEPEAVYFVLPDRPSATDLSAAATIGAGLGRLSGAKVHLAAVRDSQLTPEVQGQHHFIVVGKKGANKLLDQLDLPFNLDESNLSEDQGLIEELVSPWNPLQMILVVSGLTDEGVSKASRALNRESRFLGMRGPVSIVQTVKPPPAPESWERDIDITLASLGYEDKVVCGTAPYRATYNFYMPLGWSMMDEPRFVLSFGHSEVIDPTTSSLDVDINEVPVAGIVLDEDNVENGLLEVELPAWEIKPGRNRIHVSVEMNLAEQDKCLFIDSCHIWTVIYCNSYIHLPFIDEEVQPSLTVFPYPFSRPPDLGGLVLVVPDDPQAGDLKGMVQLAAMLGAATGSDHLAVEVVTASGVTEAVRQEKHLIVLGRPTANSLIPELDEWLPQPFEDGTDVLRPEIDTVAFVQDPARDAGLLQELASPWNSERMVLVLTGTTDEGVSLAYEMLLSRSNELRGNVAVTEDAAGKIHTYETRTSSSVQESRTVERVDLDSVLLSRLGEWWW